MNRKIFAILLVVLLGMTSQAKAQCGIENTAFSAGEFLSYDLYFNWKFVWVKVGSASMSTSKSRYKGMEA